MLNVLTQNPDVWKKTVFILCYDENDGYFDHVPPFVAPHPARPDTGRASTGIDTAAEWANVHGRESSIGLGYRVPLVIASPWSRGGAVNSQVFDHTSVIQFIETWLARKGKQVRETNITEWRRVVCGDLTSAFRPYDEESIPLPKPLDRDATVERIYNAKFRERPRGGVPLSKAEIASTNIGEFQEAGTRPACPLPYELVVNGEFHDGRLALTMAARRETFGGASQGAAFNVYSYAGPNEMTVRAYALRAGDVLTDAIPVEAEYRVRVDGPNGFMREFAGRTGSDIAIVVDHAGGQAASGQLEIRLSSRDAADRDVEIKDESYGSPVRHSTLRGQSEASVTIDTGPTRGWYDFTVRVGSVAYRYAGRVETGNWSVTDPAMGDR
jgi:phospholipase C